MIEELDAADLDPHRAVEIVDDEGDVLVVHGVADPRRLASIAVPAGGLHALSLDRALLDDDLLRPMALDPLFALLFPEGAVLDAARLAVPPVRRRAHGPLFREKHVRPRLFALRVDLSLETGAATLSDLRAFAPELDRPHLALVYAQPWFTDVETAPEVPPLILAADPPASLRRLFR